MLSQENTAKSEDQEWKKQYTDVLKELDAKEKEWQLRQQDLLKTLLRLTFTYQGSNDILDRKLQELKKHLQTAGNDIPQQEIDQLVQIIIKDKKEKDADSSRTNLLISNVVQLLNNENLFSGHSEKARDIQEDLEDGSINPIIKIKSVNNLINAVNKSLEKEKQKPDTFKVFLKKLSENQSVEPALAALCKESIKLKQEKELVGVINQVIDLIIPQSVNNSTSSSGAGENNSDQILKVEGVLSLLDWITIPGKSQDKLEVLKQRIDQQSDNKGINNVLRRIALVISNAYMDMQSELGESQRFLKKVTQQLNEIMLQVVDLETLENESFNNSVSFNADLEKQIDMLQSGVDDAGSIDEIKDAINSRIEVLQTNMDQFITTEHKRKSESDGKHQALVERLNNMEQETDQLRKNIEEERNKAYKDALTRIPNRLAFDEKINSEFQRWQRYKHRLSLCLIDIDKFKGVNDTYGHKAGDIVLRTVAEKCVTKVRKSDFFCRFGGEEFALILPETGLDAAILVAEALRKSVEKCHFKYGDKEVTITISCGLAEFKGKDNFDQVFKRADKALYKAKDSGRNCCITEEQL